MEGWVRSLSSSMSVVFSSSRLTCWAAVPNCFIESPSIRAGGGRRSGAAARKRWWGHADSTAGDLGLCRQAGSRRKEHHSMLSIGVDIGGTKIAAGVVDEQGWIIATTTRSTPATDPELLEAGVADAVAELRAEHGVAGGGGGAAGVGGGDRGTVQSGRASGRGRGCGAG